MKKTLAALCLLLTASYALAQPVNPPGAISSVQTPSAGGRICGYGDSITYRADNSNAGFEYAQGGGYLTWLNMYTGGRRTPGNPADGPGTNFGIAGATTLTLLDPANYGLLLQANCNIVIMEAGRNDVITNRTCQQTIAGLSQLIALLLGNGLTVIDGTIYNETLGTTTAAQQTAGRCVNQWRRQLAKAMAGYPKSSGYYLVDLDLVMADTSGVSRAGYLADQIHPSDIGADAIGQAYAKIVNQIIPWTAFPRVNPLDLWDGTNNPRGNILPNGPMIGAGGTVGTCTGTAPNNTSILATNWTTNGGTCTSTVVTLANGVRAWQVALAGTSSVFQHIDMVMSATAAGQAQLGDQLQLTMWVQFGATNTNVGLFPLMLAQPAGPNGNTAFKPYNSGTVFPTAGPAPSATVGAPQYAGGTWYPIRSQIATMGGTGTTVQADFQIGNITVGSPTAVTLTTTGWEISKVNP